MLKKYVIPACLSLGISLMVLFPELACCDFHWIYPLDDAYIHIALARQVAENGVWGIQPGEYAFCSSSPLWTLMLSFFFLIFGAQDWLPGVLTIVLNMCSAIVMSLMMIRYNIRFIIRIVILFLIMFVVPFSITSAVGMEHALHVLTVVMFIDYADRSLSNDRSCNSFLMPLLGAIAVATRFESLALVLPFAVFFWICGRRKESILLLVAAVLPVILYGCIAKINGGYFLPNSVMLKACLPARGNIFDRLYFVWRNVSCYNLHMYSLSLAVLASAALKKTPNSLRICGTCTFICIIGHVLFAEIGHLFRYETYIVAAGAIIVALALCINCEGQTLHNPMTSNLSFTVIFTLLLLVPLLFRGWIAVRATEDGSKNIYGQQVQLAKLFALLPENQKGTIAINDLGYMALHSDARVLDLWGLGSQEITDLKMKNQWDNEHKELLLKKHNVKYVAVFNEWFPQKSALPDYLIPVAKLNCVPATICLSEDVWLYGTSLESAMALRAHIENVCTNNLLNLPNGTCFKLFNNCPN